jgi:hypothetical protein
MNKTLSIYKANVIIAWFGFCGYWIIDYLFGEPASFIYSAILLVFAIYLIYFTVIMLKTFINSPEYQNTLLHSFMKRSVKARIKSTPMIMRISVLVSFLFGGLGIIRKPWQIFSGVYHLFRKESTRNEENQISK